MLLLLLQIFPSHYYDNSYYATTIYDYDYYNVDITVYDYTTPYYHTGITGCTTPHSEEPHA